MPTVPTTPKGWRTHTQILGAARAVFGRDGYNGARMSDVAVEAKLSMGGLYRYFDNKTALFEAVIGDIHDELYTASRTHVTDFGTEPYRSLLEANAGYLAHYSANRDVMRAFIEASNIDLRFREIWWALRQRHVERFTDALRESYADLDLDGVEIELATTAMTCMVEQCAYVWYAHATLSGREVPVATAARIVTRTWFRSFFPAEVDGEPSGAEDEAFVAELLAAPPVAASAE